MARKEYTKFKAILIGETPKAYQFRVAGRNIGVWVPRSLIQHVSKGVPDNKGHRECVVEVEDWFAEKNGL